VKAIKVKIYPKKWQKVVLEKHFGCTRFVYNLSLERKVNEYTESKKSISSYQLQKEITQLKKQDDYSWLKEVNAQSLQQSIIDLDSAFSHFFKKNNSFPKFKSKYNPKQSFRVPQAFEVSKDKKHIKIPKLKWIRFKDKFNLPTNTEFRNITISKEGNEYFASICYKTEEKEIKQYPIQENKTLGIDLGVKTLVTFSNGKKIKNPKHIKKYENKLAEEQRKLSHKKEVNKKYKESNSYQKQKLKINKIHKKIRNTRKDYLHKLTTSLVKSQNYTSYCMEDLSIENMKENNYSQMNKLISDSGWRMLRNMLEYKCKDFGKNLILIGRYEPSSKTCSKCGWIYKELKRSESSWKCSECGTKHDRDINASINIKNFGIIKSLGKDFTEALAEVRTPCL